MKFLSLALRPAGPSDRPFLQEVFFSTRWEELAAAPWSDLEKRAFLAQQFDFQSRDWDRVHPRANRQVILVDGAPAGRLYTNRSEAESDLRVVDIALLPPFRNRGAATQLFTDLFAEADAAGWKVSIHVEHQNPARRLYDRLGFGPVKDRGIYLLMERPAAFRPQPAEPLASV